MPDKPLEERNWAGQKMLPGEPFGGRPEHGGVDGKVLGYTQTAVHQGRVATKKSSGVLTTELYEVGEKVPQKRKAWWTLLKESNPVEYAKLIAKRREGQIKAWAKRKAKKAKKNLAHTPVTVHEPAWREGEG